MQNRGVMNEEEGKVFCEKTQTEDVSDKEEKPKRKWRVIWRHGQNSQIPLFFEIINVLLLFEKYLAMFETRVSQIRVWHGTQIYKNRVI